MSAGTQAANLRDADAASCRAAIAQGGLVLLDFWAQWCGPCRSLEPVLAELAGERPQLTILKVDIERHGELADALGVRGVPAMLLFKGGVCVERCIGKASFTELDRMAARHH